MNITFRIIFVDYNCFCLEMGKHSQFSFILFEWAGERWGGGGVVAKMQKISKMYVLLGCIGRGSFHAF